MLLARTKTTRRAERKGDILRMLFTAAKIMEKICSKNAGTLHAMSLQIIHYVNCFLYQLELPYKLYNFNTVRIFVFLIDFNLKQL
jgi:hypothetical protein